MLITYCKGTSGNGIDGDYSASTGSGNVQAVNGNNGGPAGSGNVQPVNGNYGGPTGTGNVEAVNGNYGGPTGSGAQGPIEEYGSPSTNDYQVNWIKLCGHKYLRNLNVLYNLGILYVETHFCLKIDYSKLVFDTFHTIIMILAIKWYIV